MSNRSAVMRTFRLSLLVLSLAFVVDCCLRSPIPSQTTVATTTRRTTPSTTRRTTTMQTTTTTTTTTTTPSTTTTLPPCVTPANSAGVTIDTGTVIRTTGLEEDANSHCTSCAVGDRNFYTSATDPDPTTAQGNSQVAIAVSCPDTQLCLCNTAGVCCQPPNMAAVPDTLYLIPYCTNGNCQMNAYLQGNMDTQLTCTNGMSYLLTGQYEGEVFNPLNTAAYFNADSVSCNGCDAIMGDAMCIGPTLTGPAT